MVNKVFIIDDDPISILDTETMMRKNDYGNEIKTFEEPKAALEIFKKEYSWDDGLPDYFFLDVQMPEINAWQFLEHYEKLHPSIADKQHVILLSATFNPEDESKAKSHPMVLELITKPVNGTILERLK